ncbi:hypothetical protein Vretifemale_14882, partial [Volvox reticuliferus]
CSNAAVMSAIYNISDGGVGLGTTIIKKYSFYWCQVDHFIDNIYQQRSSTPCKNKTQSQCQPERQPHTCVLALLSFPQGMSGSDAAGVLSLHPCGPDCSVSEAVARDHANPVRARTRCATASAEAMTWSRGPAGRGSRPPSQVR